jgi:hypothetical protein
MDSGFSNATGSDLNFMSPHSDTSNFGLQYQTNQNGFSPLNIQIASPINHNGYSPASDTSSSTIQYFNLNGKF